MNTTTSSADVLQSVATDARYAGRFTGSEISGSSFGLRVRAGYTSSDLPLLVENRSGTDLFKVKGDGSSHFNSQTTNTVATFESTDPGAGILLADDTGTSKLETSGAELRVSCDDDDNVNNSVIKFRLDGATKATLDSTGLGIGGTPIAQTYIESDNNSFAGTGSPSNYHLVLRNPQNDANEGVGIGFTASAATNSLGAAIAYERTGNEAQGDLVFSAKSSTTLGASLDELLRLDGSASSINVPDSVYLQIGSSNDLGIVFNGTDSIISNVTGDLKIQNYADDKDIIFQCDDGSGGVETYFYLDGSASSGNPITVFPDNSFLAFGTSFDFSIYHDSSNTYIANSTNDLYIQNNANDKDIIFRSDDGSGGITEYLRLDGSAISINVPDEIEMFFGSSNDFSIKHGPNNTHQKNFTGDFYISNDAANEDLIFRASDGTLNELMRLDGSASSVLIGTSSVGNSAFNLEVKSGLAIQDSVGGSQDYHCKLDTSNDTGRLRLNNGVNFGLIMRGVANNPEIGAFATSGVIKFMAYTNSGGTAGSEVARLDVSTGRLGLGSTNPDKTLVVRGSDAEIVIDDIDTTDTPRLRFRESGSTSGYIETNASNLKFYNGTTSTFTMHSSGDAEIKTDGKGLILNSPDGTAYKITVANDGTVTSTAV